MKMLTVLVLTLSLVGCDESPQQQEPSYQRFILVPHPQAIKPSIPDGALALDTKSGQLCYTVGGSYTEGFPAIDMCVTLSSKHLMPGER